MTSTSFNPRRAGVGNWRAAGFRYFSRNFYCRKQFGFRVWRVSLDGGLGCPNRDGSLGQSGCIFCNPASFSPSRRAGSNSITEQIDRGIRRLTHRYRADRFLAYLQPGTNTYAPVEQLRPIYQEAISHAKVVGLIIGTRPDCVPDEVLDLLAELSAKTWLLVEYGLQTIHDRTLEWLNRRHGYGAFLDAHRRSRQRGLRIGAHVILGLPGESGEEMLATAREVARLELHSVKLHNLHAVRGTPLAEMVRRGEVVLAELKQYVGYVVDFLEQLPPDCVVDRLSGDAPPEYLVAPSWCLDKSAVRGAIEAELRRRDTWQGRKYPGTET